jgi:16S rRNA (guanine527-N7)-methyltransferase
VELAESVAKKARAVAEILREIGVAIPVHEGAAQALVSARSGGPERFDTLVIRAVAPLEKLLRWFEPIAGSYGRMLVVKGPRWEEEKAEARHRGLAKRVLVRQIAAWPIRGSDNESVLLEIKARSG